MCEKFGVIEVSKTSNEESVMVTNVPQEQSSERKGGPIGVIELPKILYQESVEVVKNYPSGTISERMYERSEVIDVPKISYHENVEAVENIPQANFCTEV